MSPEDSNRSDFKLTHVLIRIPFLVGYWTKGLSLFSASVQRLLLVLRHYEPSIGQVTTWQLHQSQQGRKSAREDRSYNIMWCNCGSDIPSVLCSVGERQTSGSAHINEQGITDGHDYPEKVKVVAPTYSLFHTTAKKYWNLKGTRNFTLSQIIPSL